MNKKYAEILVLLQTTKNLPLALVAALKSIEDDLAKQIPPPIKGDQGPEGPIGYPGETGGDGPQGPEGKEGPVGPQGLEGPMGPEGPEGKQGPAGNEGKQGATGPRGPQGNLGPEGKQGKQGDKGQDGADGSPDSGADIVKKINNLPPKAPKIRADMVEGGGSSVIPLGGNNPANRLRSLTFVLDTPTATDVFPIWQIPYGLTISQVRSTVRGGTSVSFNIDRRTSANLNTAGSNVLGATMTATQAGVSSSSFANNQSRLNAQDFIVFVASALVGTVNQIVIEIDYTPNQ